MSESEERVANDETYQKQLEYRENFKKEVEEGPSLATCATSGVALTIGSILAGMSSVIDGPAGIIASNAMAVSADKAIDCAIHHLEADSGTYCSDGWVNEDGECTSCTRVYGMKGNSGVNSLVGVRGTPALGG